MNRKTAILIFSRSVASEAAQKRLLGSRRSNEALVTALIAKTKQTATASGLPTFLSNESDQCGASFGQRIRAAAQRVIDLGFERLIILGNDAPQLTVKDLLRAQTALEAGQAVIGRDRHGGAYLIGLNAEQCDASFAALPWQTKALGGTLAALLCAAKEGMLPLLCKSKKLVELRQLRDLNGKLDLLLLLRFLIGTPSFKWLFRLQVPELSRTEGHFFSVILAATLPLRGPPTVG